MRKVITVLLMFYCAFGMAQQTEPGIHEYIHVDEEPIPVNLTEVLEKVGYPKEAIDAGVQGRAIVRILVDEEGNYVKHEFMKELHPAISSAINEHVESLTFTPALVNNTQVKYWMNVPFPFKLIQEEQDPRSTAIEILTKALAEDTTNYTAYLNRGIQYRELGLHELALKDFVKSLEYNPEQKSPVSINPDTPDSMLVSKAYMFYAHYAKGTVYASRQEFSNAIDAMTEALVHSQPLEERDTTIQQTLPSLYLERGFAYARSEDFEAALEDFYWVDERYPELVCQTYPLIMDIYLAQRDFEKLIQAYDKFVPCRPDDPSIYYTRGFYKTFVGDYASALIDFDSTLSKEPISSLQVATLNRKGWTQMKLDKTDEALTTIQEAIKLNVLNPQSYFYLALLDEKLGNIESACQNAQKSIGYFMEGIEKGELDQLIDRLSCPEEVEE